MDLRPLRLAPGDDLRRALEDIARDGPGCFVVCGIRELVVRGGRRQQP
jgi:hypothetical protein